MKKETSEDIEQHVETADTPAHGTEPKDDTVSESTKDSVSGPENKDDSESKEDSGNTDSEIDPADTSFDKDEASDDSEEEKPAGKNTILIIELLIAAVAIVIIIFALASKNKDNNSVSDNNAVSGNIVNGDVITPGTAAIDNSVLYENIPAIPDLAELNILTEAEAEAMVSDGTMIKLATTDGGDIYINNYTDIDYLSEQVAPSEEEIDDAIFYNITYNYIETTEGSDHTTVEDGDVINANYSGKLDGVVFDGGTANNVQIMVGTGGYIPGFEEGFVGMEIGETKDVPVTFPEDYDNTDLAGKDVIFTFTVNEITGAYTVPELTDEMVTAAFYDGSATNIQECREYFRTMILQNNIWDFFIEKYYATAVSEESVHAYYNMMMESYDQMSMAYQIPVADLLSYSGITIDEFKTETILDATYTAIEYSIYESIADSEGITVTNEDITELAAEYGYADADSFISDYGETTINEYLLQSKVLDYIVSLL